MEGAFVSRTVTVWEALTLLLQESIAVQLREMMNPQPLIAIPEIAVKLTLVPSQLSVAVTVAGGTSLRHCTVTLVGTPTRTGGMVSLTVIVRVALALLVQRSRATQVQVMIIGQVPLVT